MESLWSIWEGNFKHFISYEKEHSSSTVLGPVSFCAGSDLAVKQEGLKYAVREGKKRKNERNGAITFLSHVKSVIIAVI